MKIVLGIVVIAGLLALAGPLVFAWQERFANPRVRAELLSDPLGERAQRVMLLELPSGREIPVNYLREHGRVYAGADGRWWRELAGEVHRPVRMVILGEYFEGRARAVLGDPEYERDVFSRLRPTAVPGFGTLVEILLDPKDSGGAVPRTERPGESGRD